MANCKGVELKLNPYILLGRIYISDFISHQEYLNMFHTMFKGASIIVNAVQLLYNEDIYTEKYRKVRSIPLVPLEIQSLTTGIVEEEEEQKREKKPI